MGFENILNFFFNFTLNGLELKYELPSKKDIDPDFIPYFLAGKL